MSDFKCTTCGGSAGEPHRTSGAPIEPMTAPFSNPYWDRVSSSVCAGCWEEWKQMEIKVLNEYRLNMLDKEHRAALKRHMHEFLGLDGSGSAGQVPEAVAREWKPE